VADKTIRDVAGHVPKKMLKHHSHIRTDAKRGALEGIVAKGKLQMRPKGLHLGNTIASHDQFLQRLMQILHFIALNIIW
jgi:hypothetical protein